MRFCSLIFFYFIAIKLFLSAKYFLPRLYTRILYPFNFFYFIHFVEFDFLILKSSNLKVILSNVLKKWDHKISLETINPLTPQSAFCSAS